MKGITKIKIFLLVLVFGIMSALTYAVPSGPINLTEVQDQTLTISAYPAKTNDAIAGNITELIFDVWSVTRTWQGYYGNVSGTIVLSDQNNNTLYDWNNANPNGRVYATRQVLPTWSNIRCANQNELDNEEGGFSGTNETDRNGIYPVDRPNATFVNSTDYGETGNNARSGMYANYSTFWVGPVQINGTGEAGECFSAVMHNSTGWVNGQQNAGNNPNKWREILLSDGAAGLDSQVYASILETNDEVGFDGEVHDFQMIVPEDGHGTNTAITTYYFFVELE